MRSAPGNWGAFLFREKWDKLRRRKQGRKRHIECGNAHFLPKNANMDTHGEIVKRGGRRDAPFHVQSLQNWELFRKVPVLLFKLSTLCRQLEQCRLASVFERKRRRKRGPELPFQRGERTRNRAEPQIAYLVPGMIRLLYVDEAFTIRLYFIAGR